MKLRDLKTVKQRREAIEQELDISLKNIGKFSISEDLASSRNCENMIGCVQVPIGVCGPLKLKTQNSKLKNYYIPLATTEGALVASVNRGCKVVSESGGASVVVKRVGITRAPIFRVKNITQGTEFIKNCGEHFSDFKKIAEKTSQHITLLSIRPWMVGREIYLRFSYDTKDAMGMNMVTIATSNVVSHIESKTGIKCISLSGNMCMDKKSNFLNFIEGRGFSVWADTIIRSQVIREVLKTDSKTIFDVWKSKIMLGSVMSGSIGANAQAANILAALFLATGQDIAHISEVSSVVTSVEAEGKDLYISVFLPDLPIGTVGGGTNLETQKESLSIMSIMGGNNGKNSEKFAGIIAGAALAGELSLLASLSEHSLAQAHLSLARGK